MLAEDYLKKQLEEALTPFKGKVNTPELQEEVKAKLLDVLSKTTTRKSFRPSQNELTSDAKGRLTVQVDPSVFYGMSAERLRAFGNKLDDKIPDCAVFGSGGFEWAVVDFTFSPTQEKKDAP